MTVNDPLAEPKLLLQRLRNAPGQKLSRSQFEPDAKDRKRLGTDAAQVRAARDELV
jgi:hypothetical protein